MATGAAMMAAPLIPPAWTAATAASTAAASVATSPLAATATAAAPPPTRTAAAALTVLAALALVRAVLSARARARQLRENATSYSCIVVGAGLGGVVAAKRMGDLGVDVRLFEEQAEFGGTWLLNTYPDCACDVPIAAYSFSFAQRATWSRKWAKRDEILAYVVDVAQRLGLRPRTSFRTRVLSAEFDGAQWTVTVRNLDTQQIATARANFLVVATGQLNNPAAPNVRDWDQFTGEAAFHTARWRHDVDLAGKRVACVGTGASAIQALPAIAPVVKELVVFQRSPGWVGTKADYEYGPLARALLRVPLLRSVYRAYLLVALDAFWVLIIRGSQQRRTAAHRLATSVVTSLMTRDAPPALRDALVPKEHLGCKRLLISNDWMPMFARPNVTLVTEPAARVDGRGIVTASGARHGDFDVVIWATGFEASKFVRGVDVRVRGEAQSLHDAWGGVPVAYLGATVAGFPNLGVV